jgi:hypothetical protein
MSKRRSGLHNDTRAYCYTPEKIKEKIKEIIIHEIYNDVTITTEKDLEQLIGCTKITGNLTISANIDFNFYVFDYLNIITGNLTISNNTSLKSISGFTNLTSIGNNLTISNNDKLESISGFIELQSFIDNLTITNNISLTKLTGFYMIPGILNLYIQNNSRTNPADSNTSQLVIYDTHNIFIDSHVIIKTGIIEKKN